MIALPPNGRRLRLLVTIASFGEKNLQLLKQIIRRYRSMAMDVDVVVLSNAPKELEDGVRVIVGLPSRNPWSLPFAHKAVLAENLERYDLFAYSEDDMAVTEANLQAFLRVAPHLRSDEIAGYLRYEVGQSGEWSLPEAHGSSHWKPETVERRGPYTIAEFTNEHAAFYLLTQAQLRQAIASGGFLRSPSEGRYDMACTAATDPYRLCGFRKVICISALEDFLLHHMSNRYVGQLGLPLSSFKQQVQTLMDIANGLHPTTSLCNVESKLPRGKCSKLYDEHPREELLAMVPEDARAILSVGCGWGATESKLKERGVKVTAMPLDSVIGAAAARLGIEVLYGTWDECLKSLDGREFDCVLMTHLIHLQPNPERVLEQLCRFIRQGGSLVMSGPNFARFQTVVKRTLGMGQYWKMKAFEDGGVSLCGPASLSRCLTKTGFRVTTTRWYDDEPPGGGKSTNGKRPSVFTAEHWIMQARRCN